MRGRFHGRMESRISAARARANRANNVILAAPRRSSSRPSARRGSRTRRGRRSRRRRRLRAGRRRRRAPRTGSTTSRATTATTAPARSRRRSPCRSSRQAARERSPVRLDGLRRPRRRRDLTERRAIERLFAERERMFSRFPARQRAQPREPRSGSVVQVSPPFAEMLSARAARRAGRPTASSTRRSARRSRPRATTATSPS